MNMVTQPESPPETGTPSPNPLDDSPGQATPSDKEIAIMAARMIDEQLRKRDTNMSWMNESRQNIMFMTASLVCGWHALRLELKKLLGSERI